MKQILLINGGNSFDSYESYRNHLDTKEINYDRLLSRTSWKRWLVEQLTEDEVLIPSMPNPQNAVYDEWRVYFEKFLPHLKNDVHLVGHSLGAMFLAKYLNENMLKNPVDQLILIAPGYDDETNEELGSFKITSAVNVQRNARNIHLLHSVDDPVVPYSELAKFQQDIPTATSHTFYNRGHFYDVTPTFPELLTLLKQK